MPTPSQQKALKDGLLTKNQYDKLPSHLLDGIIRKKRASASPQKKGSKAVAKGSHRMPDGSVMKNKDMPKKRTTTKGRARKGAMAGSRLAYDDTKQEKKKVASRPRSRRKRSGIKAGGENVGYN